MGYARGTPNYGFRLLQLGALRAQRRKSRYASSLRSAAISRGRWPGQDGSRGSTQTSQHDMQRSTPECSGSTSALPPHCGHCDTVTPYADRSNSPSLAPVRKSVHSTAVNSTVKPVAE